MRVYRMLKIVLLCFLSSMLYCKIEYDKTRMLAKANKEVIAQEVKKRSKRGFTVAPTTSSIAINTDTWGVRREL